MARFRAEVVKPLINDSDVLTEAAWGKIIATFTPYDNWLAAKTGAAVENLGCSEYGQYCLRKETITALIAEGQALEPEANAIAVVEKLIRYHRDLYGLLNNFVSFRDFTAAKKKPFFRPALYFWISARAICA